MHFTVDTYLSITGIVLGLVALAMAVPPFIQMFFGAPQIIIRLDHRQLINPNGKSLQVHVTNDIISGKWLRRLRVMRQPTDILAYFSISEAAKVIVPWEGAKLRTEKEHGKQVTISSSSRPYSPRLFGKTKEHESIWLRMTGEEQFFYIAGNI